MEKPLKWALGAAGSGTFIVFTLSVVLLGVPRSFPLFFIRSIGVMGVTFVLTFTIVFKQAAE